MASDPAVDSLNIVPQRSVKIPSPTFHILGARAGDSVAVRAAQSEDRQSVWLTAWVPAVQAFLHTALVIPAAVLHTAFVIRAAVLHPTLWSAAQQLCMRLCAGRPSSFPKKRCRQKPYIEAVLGRSFRFGRTMKFTEDGIFDGGEQFGRHVGRAAFHSHIVKTWESLTWAIHLMTNGDIEIMSSDEATGQWHLWQPATIDSKALWIVGRYLDRYRKVGGKWLISESKLTYEFITRLVRVGLSSGLLLTQGWA